MIKELDYTKIGTRIRIARIANNLTQEQLGEICQLSTSYVGHIERGTRIPSLDTLCRIATELQVSLDSLVFDSLPINESLFVNISAMLQNKDKHQVDRFLAVVRILADKIDEL